MNFYDCLFLIIYQICNPFTLIVAIKSMPSNTKYRKFGECIIQQYLQNNKVFSMMYCDGF